MMEHNHAAWEILTVCGSQIILIGFNVVLLALSIGNWKKRAKGSTKEKLTSASPGASPNAGVEGKGGKQGAAVAIAGSPVHVMATRTSQRVKAQAH